MSIEYLELTHFRCFSGYRLELSSGFNLFVGQNGSGKTSLLEALYYLGNGKSFKTHLPRRLIQHEQTAFSLFGRVVDQQTAVPVGVGYTHPGEHAIRINGQEGKSRAELAALLPIQLINTESYRLIDSGPAPRRAFLDWGVFHVKHDFLPLWRRVRQHIKQRNAAIKSGDYANIAVWDAGLAEMAETLHNMRAAYFNDWLAVLTPLVEQLLPHFSLSWRYYPGWPIDESLADVLAQHVERDITLGYTYAGPHRCDLICRVQGVPAEDVLSRGQQKLLVIAMRLAQGVVLREQVKRQAVYLLDDVAAELDSRHREWVLEALQALDAQVILTAIAHSDLTLAGPVNEVVLSTSDVSRETSPRSNPLSQGVLD